MPPVHGIFNMDTRIFSQLQLPVKRVIALPGILFHIEL